MGNREWEERGLAGMSGLSIPYSPFPIPSSSIDTRLLDDGAGVQVGVFQQGHRGGLGERAARADRDQPVLGFHHVAVAGDQQRGFLVGYRQHRLQSAEAAVGAPFLGHFHRGAGEVVVVLLELLLEQFEQGEGVGSGAGETGHHLARLAEPAHLARVALHHRVAQRDLAVAADHDAAVAAHADDGGGVEGFHMKLHGLSARHGGGRARLQHAAGRSAPRARPLFVR